MGKINQIEVERTAKLKKENSFLLASTAIMFLLFISIVLASFQLQERYVKSVQSLQELQQPKASLLTKTELAELNKEAVVQKLPAVDSDGKGVIAFLSVKAQEGTGKTLVDIEGLIFFADTQESIITSKNVASDYTRINLSRYDIIYTIYAQANSIGGPSAGAALAIAAIAAIQNLHLNEKVMVTGRILPDGSIGEVSSIGAKARVAKENGAEIFLVPLGQSTEKVTETVRNCNQQEGNEVCDIEKVQKIKNISDEVGIKIVEVSDVREALAYFLE